MASNNAPSSFDVALTVNDSFVPASGSKYSRLRPASASSRSRSRAANASKPLSVGVECERPTLSNDSTGLRGQMLGRADHLQHCIGSSEHRRHTAGPRTCHSALPGRVRWLIPGHGLFAYFKRWGINTADVHQSHIERAQQCILEAPWYYSRPLFHVHWPPFLNAFRFLVDLKLS